MGTAAIEEWEAEKRQRRTHHYNRAGPSQWQSFSTTTSNESARRTDHLSSPAITQEEQDLHIARKPSIRKKKIVPSSSLSAEIPETQQEVSRNQVLEAVEVSRPSGCDSQDYSTYVGSQEASIRSTQDTAISKDTTEEDSTLGSSISPQSPAPAGVGLFAIEESSSQVLLSYPLTSSRSIQGSSASVPVYISPVFTGANLLSRNRPTRSDSLNLLVARSDPIDEAESEQSCIRGAPEEHINNSLPSSPLFVTDDEDLDLQPITNPNQQREESETEEEFQVLPVVSSSITSRSRNAVYVGSAPSLPSRAARGAQLEREQTASLFTTRRSQQPHTNINNGRTSQFFSTSTGSKGGAPTRSASRRSIHNHNSRPTSSASFHSQLSSPHAPATQIESSHVIPWAVTPQQYTVTVRHQSQIRTVPSSLESPLQPVPLQPVLPTTPVQRPAALFDPASPSTGTVSSGTSILSHIGSDMPNSHRESSPRLKKPSAASEMTPESGLREKLRQIRATSRANQNARSKSQAKTTPTTSSLETRSSHRHSPENPVVPLTTSSTPAEDQPVRSLEGVDRAAGEIVLDKVDVEVALSSSLPPRRPGLDAAPGKGAIPVQDYEVENTVLELDIPTMPLLQPSEFVVPLPIDGRIKHQYVAELKENFSSINNYLNSPGSSRLGNAMTNLIRRLNDTVVHTDLGMNGPATQVASSTEEALWAEDASSKFAFLGHLISILRGSNHHVVVVARIGTTQNLLHSYLEGKRVSYQHFSGADFVQGSNHGDRDDLIRYTILPTDEASLKNIPRSASLIIALDDSFDAAMLPEWCSTTKFVPVLLLLVVNSAEHVGRCIPQDVSQPEQLRRLIRAVVHVHKDLGDMPYHTDFRHAFNLDPGARLALVKKDLSAKIAHAAGKIAEALRSKNFALNFTLRPISELDLSRLEDHPPSTEESKEVSSSVSRAGTPAGQKRPRVSKSPMMINHSNPITG